MILIHGHLLDFVEHHITSIRKRKA